MFELLDASFRYPRSNRAAVSQVSLTIPEGRLTAIVGPNGAGKTTLARLMLGLLHPYRGEALFGGRPAADWPRREMARRVGVVTQDAAPDLPISVNEFVELGRNPYVRPWAPLGPEDREHVRSALRHTDVEYLEDRAITQLSGGEVQRVKLARAFAQVPKVLVLDEPTAHLDIAHEMQIFHLVRDFVASGGSAVAITHSLHLASRFADQLFLLDRGGLAASGTPSEVLRPGVLSRVFGWPLEVVQLEGAHLSGIQVVPLETTRPHVGSEELL